GCIQDEAGRERARNRPPSDESALRGDGSTSTGQDRGRAHTARGSPPADRQPCRSQEHGLADDGPRSPRGGGAAGGNQAVRRNKGTIGGNRREAATRRNRTRQ